ncbi:MAG: phosphonate metabolism transcriptional regulator PhnF [Pseudomonadota bacterium]
MAFFYDDAMTGSSTIERGAGIAVWRQIAERLRNDIAREVWKTDERLPSEAELALRFGVNRHTVRRAVAALATEGIVRADQGRGTFVAQKPISYPISRRTRFSEIVSAQDREPGGRLIATGEMKADENLADRLDLEAGCPVLWLETVRLADAIPIATGIAWYPQDRFPTLAEAFARTGSVTLALKENGLTDYSRRETLVSADIAGPTDVQRLEVAPGDPILVLESVNEDLTGRPFNLTRTRMAGSRVQVTIDS